MTMIHRSPIHFPILSGRLVRRTRVLPAPDTPKARYAQLTALLDGVWDDLARQPLPADRAALADHAADMAAQLAELAPLAITDRDRSWRALHAYAYDASLLRHYAATERALGEAGEWELPPDPRSSRVSAHADAVLLWVELAATYDRARRAELLEQLGDVLGAHLHTDTVTHTLLRLAETEDRLTSRDQAWSHLGHLTSGLPSGLPTSRAAAGAAFLALALLIASIGASIGTPARTVLAACAAWAFYHLIRPRR